MVSVDDVFNLLTAINQTALDPMEGEIKDIRTQLH